MQAKLRIRRFNPETDKNAWWGEYTLDEVLRTDTVLDLLHRVKWEQDGTLTLRRSCAHGVCGSDAMRINGANALACKTLVKELGVKNDVVRIQVEPILGLTVEKDLLVDMEPFFDHYRSVMPYFVTDSPVPADGRERLQSPEDRARFDDTTKCILCAACTTSCPSFWAEGTAGRAGRHLRRLALPDDLQLHQRLPARDQSHRGHCRGEDGDYVRQGVATSYE